MTMDSPSRKRQSPLGDEDLPLSKRQRMGAPLPSDASLASKRPPTRQQEPQPERRIPSVDEQARNALRRSLGLALAHVGFDSASEEALESFVLMTETYLQSLIADIRLFAQSARRAQPIPTDFDISLARFNLGTAALKPHLKNPIPKTKLSPSYFDPTAEGFEELRELPLLGRELSGRPEKEARTYIPNGFPDFPSIHTYRYTPVDVDKVTVKGTGLKYDDGTPARGSEPPGVIEGPRTDPKKIREAAAVEAKQAEEALRGLLRASKINKLKEIRELAERNSLSKDRYTVWETTMRDLLEDVGKAKAAGAGAARTEVADQSMMVDAEKLFHKEVQRLSKKSAQKAST